jgi:exodeoxyribonuclease VII large subunit
MEAFLVQMADRLKAYAARLRSGALDQVRGRGQTLERLRMALFQKAVLFTPGLEAKINTARTAFASFPLRLERRAVRLDYLQKGLTHLSVRETLKRGYAVLTKADRTAVRSQAEVAVDETLDAMLYEGGLTCQVRGKKKS